MSKLAIILKFDTSVDREEFFCFLKIFLFESLGPFTTLTRAKSFLTIIKKANSTNTLNWTTKVRFKQPLKETRNEILKHYK